MKRSGRTGKRREVDREREREGGRERERGRERGREGGRVRGEKRLRQEYISYVWIRGRIRGNCLLFSLFSAAKQRFIECLQRSLSFFFSF